MRSSQGSVKMAILFLNTQDAVKKQSSKRNTLEIDAKNQLGQNSSEKNTERKLTKQRDFMLGMGK